MNCLKKFSRSRNGCVATAGQANAEAQSKGKEKIPNSFPEFLSSILILTLLT
jgi:hypothetical protein